MSNTHPLPAELVFSQAEALRKAYEKLDHLKPLPLSRFQLPFAILIGILLGSAAYQSSGSFYLAMALGLAMASWQIVLVLWQTNRRLEELVSAQMVILKDLQSMQKASMQSDPKI